MSTEREGVDCEYIEIIQILPGSSDKVRVTKLVSRCAAYKSIAVDLQYARRASGDARASWIIFATRFCNAPHA
jgi:hypothetical protein